MTPNSDTVLGAAMHAAVTAPNDPRWPALAADVQKPFITAAGHLHAYMGPGYVRRFTPKQLGDALIKHNGGLFTPKNADAAGAAFLNVITTVCDDIY